MKAELLTKVVAKQETIVLVEGIKVMHPWFFVKKLVSLGMYAERPDDVLVDSRVETECPGRLSFGNVKLKFPNPVDLGVKIPSVETPEFTFLGVLPVCRDLDDPEGVYECCFDHIP